MSRTRVKICGIGRPADAATAAALGADAVGFVLTAGLRRSVSLDVAGQIAAALPAFVTPVGVFCESSIEEISSAARTVRLRHVQLHGRYAPADVSALAPLRVIVAITADAALATTLDQWRNAIADQKLAHVAGILFDSPGGAGTGNENDWPAVRLALDGVGPNALPPVIAAGGLTSANVASVIRLLRPWAVDVSTGVEAASSDPKAPPSKSAQLIREFIRAAADADGL